MGISDVSIPSALPIIPASTEHGVRVEPKASTARVIVIAPTRAACETIEIALTLHIPTVLETSHGAEIRALAERGASFGIVAGTGTGKTMAVRYIAESLLGGAPLRIGVINREREATPETPTWNVIIVTTGIARRWFQDGEIRRSDTLIVDEIHQTSAELELCLALGKRVGNRFIWLSATVDPQFYARYLNSEAVVESSAFDPARAARVKVIRKDPSDFLDDRFLQTVIKQRRGVGMFLPTRAMVEAAADAVTDRAPRIMSAYYHGGEPVRVIRPFLEDGAAKPYFLAMTAAGQSALNVKGLDTVIIDDTRFANVVERGRNVLTRVHLGTNEILQMAGRVHGRVENGQVFILSDRDIDFSSLRPTAPEFQLAGDSERVALTCADLGVDAEELDLPVALDRAAYRRALDHLESRGLIDKGRLSRYGKIVEALPCDTDWGELIAHADNALMPFIAVMASVESLHRMTRDDRDLEGLIVSGSDHLTAYNVYAEAFRTAGMMGEVYGLPRHLFDDQKMERWSTRRGVLVKAIEDSALAMASIYRSVNLSLPTELPPVRNDIRKAFQDLLARVMPFDLVIDEQTADGQEARVSRTSVAGSWGAVAGTLRFFADRNGVPRAAIEGTQIPNALVRKHAVQEAVEVIYDRHNARDALITRSRLTWFGFELERDEDVLDVFPEALASRARMAYATALAREEARHHAVSNNREDILLVRELHRRSGGKTPRLGLPELRDLYLNAMGSASSLREMRGLALRLDLLSLVPVSERERLMALPNRVVIHEMNVPIEYDVEDVDDSQVAVARLVLPDRLARVISEDQLPLLDRPLRFVVHRGSRGSVRAASIEELQTLLDRPWMPDEVARAGKGRREQGGGRRDRSARKASRPKGEVDRERSARKRRRVDPKRRRK